MTETARTTERAASPRERLKELLDTPGNRVTLKTVSSGIRRGTGTVSDYANGIYKGDVADMDKRVAAWLGRYDARQRLPQRPVFAVTSIAEDVQGALAIAHVEGDIACVVGPSGIGKTEACRDYARKAKDVAVVTIIKGRGTPKGVCEALCDSLGLKPGTTGAMIGSIIDSLRGGRNLIIIDEADHLSPSSYDLLRQIHDNTQDDDGFGCAVAFVGMPDMLAKLKRDRYAQVYNRIGVYLPVGRITEADARKILSGVPHDAVAAAYAQSHGEARRLVKGFMRSRRMAEGRPLTAATIVSGFELLVA